MGDSTVGAFDEDVALKQLYADFERAGLRALWTLREGLMPLAPAPAARPHLWRWSELLPLAERAGALVPVGRGGERRAIALANPGLSGSPFATPTLWAALQYLGPREVAPAHRHTQGAFRFVTSGEGVWTNVDGDAVAMRRGDLLLTPSWCWHEHHNATDRPMTWLDGLDIPLVAQLDAGFFEFGPDELGKSATPTRSRSERLWAYPGLRPATATTTPSSPLVAYRWAHTDEALSAQLELELEGDPAGPGPGHAAIRFSNPTTGGDALVTMRVEMHRLARGARSGRQRQVGSIVVQVFSGSGEVDLAGQRLRVGTGDVFAVPSWTFWELEAGEEIDFFSFSDAPLYESLHLARTEREPRGAQ